MTQSNQLAIEALILERCAALRLRRSDLVRRAGFKNVGKGLRRLDQLCAGELKATVSLIAGLPAALELPSEVIADAICQTEQQLAEAERIAEQEEAAWRAKFQPSAYLLGTETKPTQITFFGITGGAERWMRIPLDLSRQPVTFAAQALTVVIAHPPGLGGLNARRALRHPRGRYGWQAVAPQAERKPPISSCWLRSLSRQ